MSFLLGFDQVAPGLMLFAVLLLVGHTASSLAREWELGTLHRYRLARTGAWPLVVGTSLGHLLLACVAFAAMLGLAGLMGFQNHGSYLDAYVVVLATAASVLGLGMAIAGLARSRDEAANLSLLLVIPLGFLSGAFFPIPGAALFGLNLYDLLPSTHALAALHGVLTDGQSLAQVGVQLAWLAGLGVVYLGLGALVFARRRLARAG